MFSFGSRFLVVKGINNTKNKVEEKPVDPSKPSNEEVFLAEIKDDLRKK